MVMSTPRSEKLRGSLRVVTDIDDTVKSSGGVRLLGIPLGGIDTQFKRGEFYPGVFQFALELSRAAINEVRRTVPTVAPQKVAVLTARAREFKFALALRPNDKLCSAFREIGRKNGFNDWGIGNVYYGSVMEWIFQERKGRRKFENFEIMMQHDAVTSNSRNSYILIGDTGERDEEAGERIARQYPRHLRAIFLHVVSATKDCDRATLLLPQDRMIKNVPIFYFRTYVGAATKAMQNGLISADALERVITQSKIDLEKKEPYREGIVSVSSKWADIEADIVLAKKAKSKMSVPWRA